MLIRKDIGISGGQIHEVADDLDRVVDEALNLRRLIPGFVALVVATR